jgi:hypothetical protein
VGGAVSQLLVLAFSTSFIIHAQENTQSRKLGLLATVNQLPGRTNRWALVIGVDAYKDSQISPLKGSANDARVLADALVRYAGFPEDQVILMSTDQPEERQPTRVNLLRRLSNLASLVPKNGLLLVSFAGHGMERNGQAYLLPSDAQISDDITFLEETAISVTRMKERIRATGAGQVVVLLDACRNDPGGRADTPNPLTVAYTKFNFDVRNREVQAFATLYATAVGERAYEYMEKRQGYFTWALVEGIKGSAANERGEVTLANLLKYLQEQVPKHVRIDLGKEQRPFAIVEGYKADELIIAAPAAPLSPKNPTPSPQLIDSAAIELSYWETIRDSSNPEDFKAYLRKYPGGTFAELAMSRINSLERSSSPKQSSPSNRGVKAEKVLVMHMIRMPGSEIENSSLSSMFHDPLNQVLVQKGLSITVLSDNLPSGFAQSNSDLKVKFRLATIARKLKGGDTAAARSIPFALVVYVEITVTSLESYNGLYVTEANGKIEAVDTNDGKVVAFERISGVRGFGNDLKQAKGNTLKNAGVGISESFINRIAEQAH